MNTIFAYIYLLVAVAFGTASNTFAKSADGFTKLFPSLFSIITIILCMYSLSKVMKALPVGITYASFAGLCIVTTSFIGVIKFNQLPSLYTVIGILFIIIGVVLVNLFVQN